MRYATKTGMFKVASLLKSWMGVGHQFRRGSDAAAELGLIPRQNSTGGKDVLLGSTNEVKRTCGPNLSMDPGQGFNEATVALANKLVRIP